MTNQPQNPRSLTVQAFWLLMAKTLAFMLAFALPILLTRTLSQHEYGLFKQVFLIVTSAISLLPLGFGMSAYYYLPRETDVHRRGQLMLNILLFNLVIGTVACLLFVLWPGLVAKIFNDPIMQSFAPLIGVVIVLWLFSTFLETAAVANQDLRLATVFIVGSQLTRTVLLLGAALLFDSVHALIYAAVIHGAVQSIALIWYAATRFPGFWRKFDWSLTRKQIAYALPFGLVGLLYTMQTDLHNYFVSHQFDPATFAIYSIGVAQLPFIGVLKESVSSVVLPRVSYLQEQGRAREILLLLVSASRKLSFVILPVYAFLMITGREFLTVMFTKAYLPSWPIFAINLTMLPLSLFEVDAVARAYERHRFFLLWLQIAVSIVMVVALWFCVGNFGLVGAISVVVGVSFVLRVVLLVRFTRVLGARLRDLVLLKDMGKIGLASAIAALVAELVHSFIARGPHPLLVMVICFVLFAVTYLTALLLLDVASDDERDKVRQGLDRLQQFVYPRRSADTVS